MSICTQRRAGARGDLRSKGVGCQVRGHVVTTSLGRVVAYWLKSPGSMASTTMRSSAGSVGGPQRLRGLLQEPHTRASGSSHQSQCTHSYVGPGCGWLCSGCNHKCSGGHQGRQQGLALTTGAWLSACTATTAPGSCLGCVAVDTSDGAEENSARAVQSPGSTGR